LLAGAPRLAPPGPASSAVASPRATLATSRGITSRPSDPVGGSSSSRWRSRPTVPRCFAATASATQSFGAARGGTFVLPASAADPLRLSAEGALPHAMTSDAPCRPDGAHPSSPARARRHAPCLSSGPRGTTAGPGPRCSPAGLGRKSSWARDAFRRLDPSVLRPLVGALSLTFSSLELARHPSARPCGSLPRHGIGPPRRAPLPRLASPRGPAR